MEKTFIRAELHNHTTESDGALSVQELVQYASVHDFEVMALTDHNTVSGQQKAIECAAALELSILSGVEVTTFYGHILALGLKNMIDISTLNPENPEPFLAQLKHAGVKAIGVAHPFCLGAPIAGGCRMQLDMNQMLSVDYIEVANVSAPDAIIGNATALAYWEAQVLKGNRLAAVSGKDLHTTPKEIGKVFSTFVPYLGEEIAAPQAVLHAILNQETILSKGPLCKVRCAQQLLEIAFDHSSQYCGWSVEQAAEMDALVVIKEDTGAVHRIKCSLLAPVNVMLSPKASSATVAVYDTQEAYHALMIAGISIFIDRSK